MDTFDERTARWEKKMQRVVTQLLTRQRKALVRKVNTAQKAAPDLGTPEDWLAEFRDTVKPVLRQILTSAAEASIEDYALGISFDVLDPHVTEWLDASAQRFATQVNATTWDQLRTALADGVREGESIADLAERVAQVMGDRIASSAETIARTQVIPAFNAGTHESWRQSGVVKRKRWLSTNDGRTRDAHVRAHGQEVGLDEPFVVDGEDLLYPGDPAGSPENIINCRCTMTAVVE